MIQKKIFGILVCMLLIATSLFSVSGLETKMNEKEKEYSTLRWDFEQTVVDKLDVSLDSSTLSISSGGDQVYNIYEGLHWRLYITAYWDPPQGQPICIWVDPSTLPEGATVTPPGCSCGIDSVTITLDWTPAVGQAGTYMIRFYVGYDCYEPYSYFDITVIVHPYNPQPSETYRICAGEPWELRVTVYWDPPQPEKLICLWVDEYSLPEGAVFDECHCDYGSVTSTLRWTPTSDQVGEYIITFLAGEECGYYMFPFSIRVIVEICEDNEPPIVIKEYPIDGETFTEPDITAWGYITDNVGVVSFGYVHEWEGGGTGSSWSLEEPTTNYSFEIPITLCEGWNRIRIEAWDAAGNYGYDEETVTYNVDCSIDLDIIWQTNTSELVSDNVEDNTNVHAPGRALSLNRGANCLKRIYVRQTVPPNINYKLKWTNKLIVYEDKTKTTIANKIYSGPREFWVEAIDRSTARNDQTVTATIIVDPCNGTSDTVCFTNFQVDITVRISGQVSPQAENDKHDAWVADMGNANLGLLDNFEGGLYGAGIEIVGQLLPNTLRADDFFNDEFYWRQNYDERIYVNNVLMRSNDNHPDDPWLEWQDVTPSNTGKIYYLDSPGDPLPTRAGDIKAVRLRFEGWSTFAYHEGPGPKGDNNNNDVRPVPQCWKDCSVNHKWYVSRRTLDNTGSVNPGGYWQPNLVDNGPHVLGLNWEWNYKPPNFWLWCRL
ncbi:MAG: hypothetical protein J7K13_00755 [Thermoplasmata archaeon]|nr:hypothetical protein [Thermoplasmata archaeon]